MPPTAAATGVADLPDAWRIEVFRLPAFDDPDGTHLLDAARELGVDGLQAARRGRGYLFPASLSADEIQRIASELCADPVLEEARVTAPGTAPATSAGRRVLVARKPGVMDPVAMTVERVLRKAGFVAADAELHVQTFSAWELEGDLSTEATELIARTNLANEVIEDLRIDQEGLPFGLPSATPEHGVVTVPIAGAEDATLERISTDGQLSLNLVEMHAVQEHYAELGREPTACELETIAQTWSEHCQHKTFRGLIEMDGEVVDNLLKSTIAAATHELDKDWCISVFHDNAGIIEFDDGWDLAFKVETHNHPSAIDPYGGAGTGIGGVIRDILGVGLGAKPIANTDAFFVGPSDLPADQVPKGSMHPRRILRGVVKGVRDYGNRMGIPTLAGGLWYHEGYVGNPLVYAGTLGILPRACATKEVHPGDVILVVGGRTGRDGIHGATFSSVELHSESETTSASAVQIGDPITEKKVLDGLLVARDARLYRGITDCGAGGLSSAVGEMGAECGAEVDLEKVPLKYPGLSPEEIWISEAQERMVLAVPPADLEKCIAVFEAEDVEATPIGLFTDTKKLVLRYAGTVMGELDMHFLHEGTPRPTRRAEWTPPSYPDPGCPAPADPAATFLAMLARPNVQSREWIVRQYDHEVQGMSVVKALCGERADAPSDGVVIKPLVSSKKGVALGHGANPRYGSLDPRAMAESAIDEAMRNVVAVGGDPARTALLDNFSWGNCDKPQNLGALVHAARGCYAAAMAYGAPFISGKDSLNNDYRTGGDSQGGGESRSIPPTLYVSALSIVQNAASAVTMDAKKAGNLLLLVGITKPELGGSELLALLGLEGGRVPRPDLELAPKVFEKLNGAMKMRYIESCHDLSEGGLAVAVAEMCVAGGLGADIDLSVIDHDTFPDGPAAYDENTTLLYSESTTRFLVEVQPGKKFNLQTKLMGVAVTPLGRFQTSGKIRVKGTDGRPLLDVPVEDARAALQSGFQG